MRIFVCSLIVLFACCGGKHVQSPTPPAGADAVTQIQAAVEQWRQSNEVRSAPALLESYELAATTELIDQGKRVIGGDAVTSWINERIGGAKEVHLKLGAIAIVPASDSVIVSADMTREVSNGSTTIVETGILTLVLRSSDAQGEDSTRWKIIHQHFSYRGQ